MRKRAAAPVDEEGQVAPRQLIEDRLKLGQDRNRYWRAGLFLGDVDHALAHMLPTHADDIAGALDGVEAQFQRDTRRRVDRVSIAVLRDLLLKPGVKAVRLDLRQLDPGGRIAVDRLDFGAVAQNARNAGISKRALGSVCSVRRSRMCLGRRWRSGALPTMGRKSRSRLWRIARWLLCVSAQGRAFNWRRGDALRLALACFSPEQS